MRNQVNITRSKETNKATITIPKEMEIYQVFNEEFRMALLKKFREL